MLHSSSLTLSDSTDSPQLRLLSSPHTWPHSVNQPITYDQPWQAHTLPLARLFSWYRLDLALDTLPAVLRCRRPTK